MRDGGSGEGPRKWGASGYFVAWRPKIRVYPPSSIIRVHPWAVSQRLNSDLGCLWEGKEQPQHTQAENHRKIFPSLRRRSVLEGPRNLHHGQPGFNARGQFLQQVVVYGLPRRPDGAEHGPRIGAPMPDEHQAIDAH